MVRRIIATHTGSTDGRQRQRCIRPRHARRNPARRSLAALGRCAGRFGTPTVAQQRGAVDACRRAGRSDAAAAPGRTRRTAAGRRGSLPRADCRGRPFAGAVRAERAAWRGHGSTGPRRCGRRAAGHRRTPPRPDPDGPPPARPGRHAPDRADPPAAWPAAAADRLPQWRSRPGAPVRGAGQRRRRFPQQADPATSSDRGGVQPHPPREGTGRHAAGCARRAGHEQPRDRPAHAPPRDAAVGGVAVAPRPWRPVLH